MPNARRRRSPCGRCSRAWCGCMIWTWSISTCGCGRDQTPPPKTPHPAPLSGHPQPRPRGPRGAGTGGGGRQPLAGNRRYPCPRGSCLLGVPCARHPARRDPRQLHPGYWGRALWGWRDGALDLVLASLRIADAQPVTDPASIKGQIEVAPFVIAEATGLGALILPEFDAEIDLPVQNLDFLTLPDRRHQAGLDLQGPGPPAWAPGLFPRRAYSRAPT
jgi:hypothetical protein